MAQFQPSSLLSLRNSALAAVFKLPPWVLRLLAEGVLNTPRTISGQELDSQAHLLIALANKQPEPDYETLTPEESRKISESLDTFFAYDGPPLRRVEELQIRGADITLSARLYIPRGAIDQGPLLVYFHGGGFVDGSVDMVDHVCRYIAARSGVSILSAEYRKAPEFPFPIPVEDGLLAFDWAQTHALELGVKANWIAVGGDSAGANLAAVVAQLRRDAPNPPAYQLLIYPAVDLSKKTESFVKFGKGAGFTEANHDWFLKHYATPEQQRDPRLSPFLTEDLTGLPPALVVTAGVDILHDEGEAYAQRLERAGVTVDARCYSELFHGFVRFYEYIDRARCALDEISMILRRRLMSSETCYPC